VLEHTRQVEQFSPGNAEGLLLNLQARMHLLVSGEGTDASRQKAWQDIDDRLAARRASATGDEMAIQVELLRAESALLQDKLDQAEAVLDEIQRRRPGDARAAVLRAQLHVRQGRDEQAIDIMQRAVQESPQSVDAVTRLALLYNGQGKRPECESVVRDALVGMEERQDRRRLGLFLAGLYSAWGQDDRLYEWLSDMAKEFPADIQTKRRLLAVDRVLSDSERAQAIVEEIKSLEGEKGWQWRIEQARVWIRSESFRTRHAETIRLLRENLSANPEDRTSRMLLGAAYEKAGEMQLAVTTYKEVLSRSRPGEDLPVMLVLAAAYEKADNMQAALATYREALKRSPESMQVIGRIVGVLYKAQEFAEAQKILDEAAQRDLHHADLQKLRLQGDLQRGALGPASDILQEMVHEDPNDTSAKFTLALIRAKQKRFAEAQDILRELKAKTPDSIRIAEAQVGLQIEQGNADEALRLCDELVKRLNNVSAHTLRARTYVGLGQQAKALADLDQVVSLQPEEPAVWLTRANFYRDLGRTADEIEDLKKALSLAPDSLMIQQRALPLFLASGNAALARQAEATLEQSLTAHPENVELKVLKARVLIPKRTASSTREARSLLAEITTNNPQRTDAWELLGRLDLSEGQPGDAVDVALRGLAHSPEDRRLCLLKADAEARRSPMLAVPTLKELLRQDPNDLDVIVRLTDAHLQSGRPERALELLEERLPALKGTARRRGDLTLAMTLYRNGDTDRAISLFRTLMQAEPDDPAPLVALAQLPEVTQRCPQLEQFIADWIAGHPGDVTTPTTVAAALVSRRSEQGVRVAESILKSVLERTPESVPALLILADLTVQTGRAEESAAANRRILEVDPNNVLALNNLAWFLCEERGKYQEALDLADRGLQIAPDYLDLIDTRGVAHYRMGHFDDAVKDFTRFIELCPSRVRSLTITRFHLARTYASMGRRAEATRELEETLSAQNRSGGLPPSDLAEAKVLLEQLKKGS
jgi:tetratricopeptide (TPR) repeat protein